MRRGLFYERTIGDGLDPAQLVVGEGRIRERLLARENSVLLLISSNTENSSNRWSGVGRNCSGSVSPAILVAAAASTAEKGFRRLEIKTQRLISHVRAEPATAAERGQSVGSV
jgi:hypothetical protein